MFSNELKKYDPALVASMERELDRQEYKLELIASENYVSRNVLEAMGSILTNKYAEGYPGKRYYGGCEYVDEVENLAIERAKQLFGAEAANVQPHSGSQANMAVYFSLLEPGDTILGMDLSHGGHLTHGSPVNFSGRFFKVIGYGVDPQTERIDFDQVRKLAREHKPKLIVTGASAYARDINFAEFRKIADEVGCLLMADIAHPAGLVAAKVHSDPVPYCDVVTSTTHKTLRGPRSGMILMKQDLAAKINKQIFPGIQGGPHMHTIAAKAVTYKEALEPEFKNYAKQIVANSKALVAELTARGLRIVSGGSDNHMCLVDLTAQNITGKDAEAALGLAGITVNKNTIPQEKRSPFITSGIRIGTPAITTRGMKETEMKIVGGWIADALQASTDEKKLSAIREDVKSLCKKFPIYL